MIEADYIEIHELLCQFFLAFDERDWRSMEETLSSIVIIDYSSSGREPPTQMTRLEFVERRRNAIDDLEKQHSFSNLRLTTDDQSLRGRCNYIIHRFAKSKPPSGDDFYHSCGSYVFGFTRMGGLWKIDAITQHSLRSWGNATLHGGRAR